MLLKHSTEVAFFTIGLTVLSIKLSFILSTVLDLVVALENGLAT